jgi:hypothetical protein
MNGATPGAPERRSDAMKYLMLIYENPGTRETFFGDEELMGRVNAIVDELRASGEYVDGEGLADPSQAKAVRLVEGAPAVTDGPFAEAKEFLGGFMIVDCESIERAVDIAMRFPHWGTGGMEVRPLMDGSGTEM